MPITRKYGNAAMGVEVEFTDEQFLILKMRNGKTLETWEAKCTSLSTRKEKVESGKSKKSVSGR